MRAVIGGLVIAALLSIPTPALAGLAEHTETCTEAMARLSDFPSRGVHTVTAYFSGDATGQVSKSFTGTSGTVRFAVPQNGLATGESYTVLYSWKGSMGGTKPPPFTFVCS